MSRPLYLLPVLLFCLSSNSAPPPLSQKAT
jgi:hypothetical protein